MSKARVTAYKVIIAATGGFVRGEKQNGQRFSLDRLPYDLTAAITGILNGPNPEHEFDAQGKDVFSCSATTRLRFEGEPIALLNPTDNDSRNG